MNSKPITQVKAGLFILHSDKLADVHLLNVGARRVLPLWRGAVYDAAIGELSSAAQIEQAIADAVNAANARGELIKCFEP